MATVIRLKRIGKKKEAHYRIVVCDSRMARDGRPLEEIGTYNPNPDPFVVNLDRERVTYWLGVGAKPSDTVKNLFKREGIGKPAPAAEVVTPPVIPVAPASEVA